MRSAQAATRGAMWQRNQPQSGPRARSVVRVVLKSSALVLAGLLALAGEAPSQTAWTTPSKAEVDAIYPDVEALYIDLHRNPEPAFQEVQTAAAI